MSIRYRMGSGAFGPDNLRVLWRAGAAQRSWWPGRRDRGNLGGITPALDGVGKHNLPAFPPGLLSRDGYTLLDDSHTPLRTRDGWISPRKDRDAQDWYLFVYGNDYAHFFREYCRLCGRIPMVPRYVFGPWVTDLNWEFMPGMRSPDDRVLRAIAERFRNLGIPLDVFVLDYAWHLHGWEGGYAWSPIFPSPREFLSWARARGIQIALNDHPGDGTVGVLSWRDPNAQRIARLLRISPPRAPTFSEKLDDGWRFRFDLSGRSDWSSPKLDDRAWRTTAVHETAADVPDRAGIWWYRRRVGIPASWRGKRVLFVVGGVCDQYDLYVNGTPVGRRGDRSQSICCTKTWVDITRAVRFDGENLIALRMRGWHGRGRFNRGPVELTDEVAEEHPIKFNLADRRHATVFMDVLHRPLLRQGIAFWWVDGGGKSCADMPGLDSQLWTNEVYFRHTERCTGRRGFIFSRSGGPGGHRYPALFTGDTFSQWEVLAYEVRYTVNAGANLQAYVTHDVGGFLGGRIERDLYLRWVQFCTFSPLVRLHCCVENPRDGNMRLPWVYGPTAVRVVRQLFRLRHQLIPYLYSYAWAAHESGLPLVRGMYLEHPDLPEAYRRPDQYYLGREILVAPIVTPKPERDIYLPPGGWTDLFTGKRWEGGRTLRCRCPIDRMPVFVKDGAIIPMQPVMAYSHERPVDPLILEVFGIGGMFDLYEDDGISRDYLSGRSARTRIISRMSGPDTAELTVGPTLGSYRGMLVTRAYEVRFHGMARPSQVSVEGTAGSCTCRWTYHPRSHMLVVTIPRRSIREPLKIIIRS